MKKLLLVVLALLLLNPTVFCKPADGIFDSIQKKVTEASQKAELTDKEITSLIDNADFDRINKIPAERFLNSKYQGREFLSLAVYYALKSHFNTDNKKKAEQLAFRLLKAGVDVNFCPDYYSEQPFLDRVFNESSAEIRASREGGNYAWCAWNHMIKEDYKKGFSVYFHKHPIYQTMFSKTKKLPIPTIHTLLFNAISFPADSQERGELLEYVQYIVEKGTSYYPDYNKALKDLLLAKDKMDWQLAEQAGYYYINALNYYEKGQSHESAVREGAKIWKYVRKLHKDAGVPLPNTNYVKQMLEIEKEI